MSISKTLQNVISSPSNSSSNPNKPFLVLVKNMKTNNSKSNDEYEHRKRQK